MVLQEEYLPRREAHQAQILPVRPWRHAKIGDTLLVELLSSGRLDVCQGHTYPEHPKIASHQVCRFFLAYNNY